MTLDFASVLPDASRDCSDTKSGDSHKRAPASTLNLLSTPTERARARKSAAGVFGLGKANVKLSIFTSNLIRKQRAMWNGPLAPGVAVSSAVGPTPPAAGYLR